MNPLPRLRLVLVLVASGCLCARASDAVLDHADLTGYRRVEGSRIAVSPSGGGVRVHAGAHLDCIATGSVVFSPGTTVAPGARLSARVRPPGAFRVTTIQAHGPDDQQLVWVFLAEGFTWGELGRFDEEIRQTVAGMLAHEPWRSYAQRINIYAIPVPSAQSGADRDGRLVDTYFGASYSGRLLVADVARAYATAFQHVPDYDSVLVYVNDATYGGSGGPVCVFSKAPDVVQRVGLALHEHGHSFANLADEYEGAAEGYPAVPRGEPNVTIATRREDVPWRHLIDHRVPVPTVRAGEGRGNLDALGALLGVAPDSLVGAIEGAYYRPTGVYRPCFHCMMRTIDRPFCQVCIEALVGRIHAKIDRWPRGISATGGPSPSLARLPEVGE